MRKPFLARVTVLASVTCVAAAVTLVTAQTPGYRAPRGPDGKPNLNGIWQAINSANYDIEAHSAAPSPVLDLGASGAVPAGLGVVEGGTLPYTPEALKKRNENRANRLKLDPEIKCYLPGVPRATYMPFPFQIIQSQKHVMVVHEYAGAVDDLYGGSDGSTSGQLDGMVERTLGGGDAGRRYERLQRPELVRSFRKLSQRCTARGGTVHGAERRYAQLRGDSRGFKGLYPPVEDEHAALPAGGAQRADSRVQMRRIRGRSLIRTSAETAESVSAFVRRAEASAPAVKWRV